MYYVSGTVLGIGDESENQETAPAIMKFIVYPGTVKSVSMT